MGGSASNTISVSLVSGSSQSVGLLCSAGLPAGATCNFAPVSGTPTFSSQLTISTSSSTSPGLYTITVTGTGGGITHTTQFTLTVGGGGSVGGIVIPIGKLALLSPFVGLASLIVAAATVTAVCVRRVKDRKENQ